MKDEFLRTRVPGEVKEAFIALAKRKKLTASELLRQLVTGALSDGAKLPPIEILGKVETTQMLVRVPKPLRAAMEERAKLKAMTASRWLACLAQSNLMADPVMTDKEILTLRALNRELSAIGRNINQIAKQLNSAFDNLERSRVEQLDFKRIKRDIELTKHVVSNLVKRSQQSWESPGEEN